MNKNYVVILSLLLLSNLSYGYIVYLNDHTSSDKVDFYVHTSLAGCCYGCGGTGECKVTTSAAGRSGKYNMKDRHYVCKGACIQCITARIYKNGQTFEATLNLASQATMNALEAIGSGTTAGAGGIYLGPEALAVGAAAGAVAGAVVGGAMAIKYQCTDMEVTLSEQDNGYRYDYKKR